VIFDEVHLLLDQEGVSLALKLGDVQEKPNILFGMKKEFIFALNT
jgi:hypothetical protein